MFVWAKGGGVQCKHSCLCLGFPVYLYRYSVPSEAIIISGRGQKILGRGERNEAPSDGEGVAEFRQLLVVRGGGIC